MTPRASPGRPTDAPATTRRPRLRLSAWRSLVVAGVVLASPPRPRPTPSWCRRTRPTASGSPPRPPPSACSSASTISADLGGLRVVSSSGQSVDAGTDTVSGPTLSVAAPARPPRRHLRGDLPGDLGRRPPGQGRARLRRRRCLGRGVDAGSFVNGSGSDRDLRGARRHRPVPRLRSAPSPRPGSPSSWPSSTTAAPEARPLARIVRGAALVGVVGALGTLGTQAALATGRGWSAVFDPARAARRADRDPRPGHRRCCWPVCSSSSSRSRSAAAAAARPSPSTAASPPACRSCSGATRSTRPTAGSRCCRTASTSSPPPSGSAA